MIDRSNLKGRSLRMTDAAFKRINEGAAQIDVKQYEWIHAAITFFRPEQDPDHAQHLHELLRPDELSKARIAVQSLRPEERRALAEELLNSSDASED